MTELIPGKRYRVTVEGIALTARSLPLGDGVCLYNNVLEIAKIELIPDPLPAAPASVIQWTDHEDNPHKPIRRTAIRTTDNQLNRWRDQFGNFYTDSEIPEGWIALFDAGAE